MEASKASAAEKGQHCKSRDGGDFGGAAAVQRRWSRWRLEGELEGVAVVAMLLLCRVHVGDMH